jgi:aspartate aminotransferase-like enzyme
MKKQYLLAPGPTPVPPEALQAMAMPILHHRSPEFVPILAQVKEDLKWLFQTTQDVLILTATGTGGMVAAVTNFLSPEDKALCVRGGKFGERWAEICGAYGITPVNLDVEWGTAVDPQRVEDALKADPSIKGVYFQASETSTGVAHPTREIAELCRRREGTLCVVDAITAMGVVDLPTDAWGLDVVVTGSQKALMLPPGLAFVSVSEKAWAFNRAAKAPRYYFNLAQERKKLRENQTLFTTASSLVVGLKAALEMMKAEGLPGIFARHDRLARATRAGVEAMGLELYAKASPSDALTAVKVPAGIDGGKVTKILRDTYGVTVAGGQSQLKGKIFRIAHLGYAGVFDVITALAATEMTMKGLGHPVTLGQGVAAAEAILMES